MKKYWINTLRKFSGLAMYAAVSSTTLASWFSYHQPAVPMGLSKFKK